MSQRIGSRIDGSHRARPTAIAIVPVALLAAAFAVPLLGVVASLAGAAVASILGPRIWPDRSRVTTIAVPLVTFVSLWAGAVAAFAGVSDRAVTMAWLLIPLCAPSGASLALGPLAAVGVFAAVALGGVHLHRPWSWPVAAVAGVATYELTFERIVDATGGWVC